jgi:hypothetical protein
MKMMCLSFLFSGMSFWLMGQTSRAELPLRDIKMDTPSQTYSIPLEEVSPFLSWSVVWNRGASGLWVRFSSDERVWTEWVFEGPELHAAELPGLVIGQLRFEDAAMRFFQVRANEDVSGIVFHFFSPGSTEAVSLHEVEETMACPCPMPTSLRRTDWCPAGNCPQNPNPSFTAVTHLIVHHSASSNTASDWAAVVRSFWNFHVNTNGWADIGYNWLIDPNGALYEGRGDNVTGAHFCGTNGATMGVCVIGDFTSSMPTSAALAKLRDLLAWKACNINADPLATTFHSSSALMLKRISGHRDGCTTACPGDAFYPMLPTIRQGVSDHIAQVCSALDAPEVGLPENGLRVYPNPAGDWLFIDTPFNSGGWLQVVDNNGIRAAPLHWVSGAETIRISLSGWPSGIYRAVLRNLEGTECRAAFIKP